MMSIFYTVCLCENNDKTKTEYEWKLVIAVERQTADELASTYKTWLYIKVLKVLV